MGELKRAGHLPRSGGFTGGGSLRFCGFSARSRLFSCRFFLGSLLFLLARFLFGRLLLCRLFLGRFFLGASALDRGLLKHPQTVFQCQFLRIHILGYAGVSAAVGDERSPASTLKNDAFVGPFSNQSFCFGFFFLSDVHQCFVKLYGVRICIAYRTRICLRT